MPVSVRKAVLAAAVLVCPGLGIADPTDADSAERRVAVWVLNQGGTLILHGGQGEIRASAELPDGPFQVREIVLTGTLVHPRDLERLHPLRNLKTLTLPGTMWNPVCCGALGNTDDSDLLAHLAVLESLESLHLSHHFLSVFKGIRIFDHGIEKLVPLRNLRSLQLKSTRATGMHLDAFPDLVRLDLTQTDVNDDGLRRIARLKNLKTLRLRSTYITDDGLGALAGIPELVELDLADTGLSDTGLAGIATLKHLRVLNLRGAQVSDAGLAHLALMENLVDLNLYRTRVTNAGIPRLSALSALKRVDLRYSRVTNAGVSALRAALPGVDIAFLETAPPTSALPRAELASADLDDLVAWTTSIGASARVEPDGLIALSLRAKPVGDREVSALGTLPGDLFARFGGNRSERPGTAVLAVAPKPGIARSRAHPA